MAAAPVKDGDLEVGLKQFAELQLPGDVPRIAFVADQAGPAFHHAEGAPRVDLEVAALAFEREPAAHPAVFEQRARTVAAAGAADPLRPSVRLEAHRDPADRAEVGAGDAAPQ